MFVAFHYPFFGSATVDAHQLVCPRCNSNDWKDRDISSCNPGDEFQCARCGKIVWINWGLEEPDHTSTWLSSEHCPHWLCQSKYAELREAMGWTRMLQDRRG